MTPNTPTGHESGGPGSGGMQTKVCLDLLRIESAAARASQDRDGRGWAILREKVSSQPRQPKSSFPTLIIIFQIKRKDQIYRRRR